MNLSDIITKCYILALIIRDDGERLLLGDGIFEFKSSLQHFAPNIYQNDIVELQGTDGQLLAGQVRRSATQAFDGYIADGTIGKTDTEQSRRRFLGFFRKKHHYKVVYIMPDGTAIQRDRGYIVDAPEVQELYQRFPEYHIGLNFEDPNYYEYNEGEDGEEIPANTALISLANLLAGGLVWDNLGAVSQEKTWLDWENGTTVDGFYSFNNGLAGAPLEFTHLYGNATQKTIAGNNLFDRVNATENQILTWTDGNLYAENKAIVGDYISASQGQRFSSNYNAHVFFYDSSKTYLGALQTDGTTIQKVSGGTFSTFTIPSGYGVAYMRVEFRTGTNSSLDMTQQDIMLNEGATFEPYEPYCGGTPSPNPDYPQEVKTVSGLQTVKITGKNLLDPTPINPTVYHSESATSRYYYDANLQYHIEAGKTYTLSLKMDELSSQDAFRFSVGIGTSTGYRHDVNYVGDITDISQRLANTFTVSQADIDQYGDVLWMRCPRYSTARVYSHTLSDIQLEYGNQATAYEPYQAQSYTIDLASAELCKIGTYQDYIWNDEGTWKIHKAINKIVLNGTENWALGSMFYCTNAVSGKTAVIPATGGAIMSDYFTYSSGATNDPSIDIVNGNVLRIRDTSKATVSDLTTWLGTHPTTVYYALATPTDTEITDSELIQQLSAILKTYQGVNNVWLIPSAGAQGELSVHYATGSIDVGAGYEWEEGSGDNSNIVENPGIDRVNPIWKVPGPATNPTLTNITTGQTISWIGSVASGETLTVDLNNQTAELGGANVFSQLSGDWLALAPGANRIEYSATGATEGCTLEWNGVVG